MQRGRPSNREWTERYLQGGYDEHPSRYGDELVAGIFSTNDASSSVRRFGSSSGRRGRGGVYHLQPHRSTAGAGMADGSDPNQQQLLEYVRVVDDCEMDEEGNVIITADYDVGEEIVVGEDGQFAIDQHGEYVLVPRDGGQVSWR